MAGGIASELAAAGFEDAAKSAGGRRGRLSLLPELSRAKRRHQGAGVDLDDDDRERFLREGYAMGGCPATRTSRTSCRSG